MTGTDTGPERGNESRQTERTAMGQFTFTETKLCGVYLIDPTVHGDHRGYFIETYNEEEFQAAGLCYRFVQDNQSASGKGVIRGLHFQKHFPQAKLVRALKGAVLDVVVDLRDGSDTYGQWVAEVLSEDNHRQLMVPRGFAHGYQVLTEYAEFAYKCDDFYHPEDEDGIPYNDPDVGVEWAAVTETPILSEKDRNRIPLSVRRAVFPWKDEPDFGNCEK